MRRFIKEYATVYTENGINFIMLPDGKKIPHITKTKVTDDCNSSVASVEIRILCNIVSTREEAIKNYEK